GCNPNLPPPIEKKVLGGLSKLSPPTKPQARAQGGTRLNSISWLFGSHGKARLKRYNNSSAGARNRCGATRKASRRGNSRAPDQVSFRTKRVSKICSLPFQRSVHMVLLDTCHVFDLNQPHGPSRAYFGDVVKYVGQRKYTSRRIFMRYWLKGAIEPGFSVASPRPEPFTQFFCPGLNLGIPKERDNGYCGLKSHDPDFEGYYMFAANLQSTNLGFNCTGKLRNSYWCCKGWVPYYNDPLNLVHEKDVRGMCSEHPQHN
ncbi:hypothetical protein PSHT_02433, partial [Puccinia striiformis]